MPYNYANSQQTRHFDPMLGQCWPTVYDVGPTLAQNWVDMSFKNNPLSLSDTLQHIHQLQIIKTIIMWTSWRCVWLDLDVLIRFVMFHNLKYGSYISPWGVMRFCIQNSNYAKQHFEIILDRCIEYTEYGVVLSV